MLRHTIVNYDVKWKRFPHYWPFMRGIKWRGASMFSLICTWANSWVNNRDDGDLRRHRVHYDVTVLTDIYISYSRICLFKTPRTFEVSCYELRKLSVHVNINLAVLGFCEHCYVTDKSILLFERTFISKVLGQNVLFPQLWHRDLCLKG